MTHFVDKEEKMSKVIIPECKDIGGMKEDILSPTERKDGAIGLFSRLLRLDSLSKRNSVPESPTNTDPPTTYYGVYIPCEIKKASDEEALHVYKNKSEAMELVMRYKTARFKAFKNRQDAVSFALRGAEPVDTADGNDNSVMGEKPYPFKAPSPQDMVAVRKAIESGLACAVRERVWDNPRFLVSSGNTPAIMQEGSRYNALHIAAKAMNADICNLILTTVGNPVFVQSLYGSDADPESCKEFASMLVDRYLNTPDKAMNETPLHFAAKYGAAEVVDVLTSFPQCNKNATNKYGEQPQDIICKRASKSTPETVQRISSMLGERFYVPVLHAEDGSGAPTIGRPFTPAEPPEINGDPLSPRYEIRAYAGPMERGQADLFRRRWKTPPRAARLAAPTFRLKDKGLEAVGRNLADQTHVGWKEYWPFLDTFTDLRSPEGLTLLENYLKAKYEDACSSAYNKSCATHSPSEISFSRISLSISRQSNDCLSPVSELCVAMNTCTIADRPPHWSKTDPVRQRLCRQPNQPIKINGESNTTPLNHTVSQLLCIERTCQVFAKRISDSLIFSMTAEPELAGDSLKNEAKHLQHTMFTYMDDERFQNINFGLIHSRLAQLVVYKLKQQTKDLDDINHLMEFLVKLRCPNDDIFSSDDERKQTSFRSRVKLTHVIDNHVRCISSFICDELTEQSVKGPALSECECVNIWAEAERCRCEWKVDSFGRNSKKNASFRKNRSILSTSPKSESFIRRLIFDHDIGDGKLLHNEAEQPVSVNSGGGDSGTLYTIDVAKCQVVDAEISDDESCASCDSEGEYLTASERGDDDMCEASDTAIADTFIYGEEPTKMDRLVFDAICDCPISSDKFPNVYRWRHTIALHSSVDRDKWGAAPILTAEDSNASWSAWNERCPWGVRPRARPDVGPSASPGGPGGPRSSTPRRDTGAPRRDDSRTVPLQVSTWLRVTGPNSPRSALADKNIGHNVSFGF